MSELTGVAVAAAFLVGLVLGNPRLRGRLLSFTTAGSLGREITVSSQYLHRMDVVLIQFEVRRASRLAGVEIGEMRLPGGAQVTLLARGEELIVPPARLALMVGDHALVVTTRRHVGAVRKRLRALARSGRLAQWVETIPTKTSDFLGDRLDGPQ
jgi:cell volume regulation protein A